MLPIFLMFILFVVGFMWYGVLAYFQKRIK